MRAQLYVVLVLCTMAMCFGCASMDGESIDGDDEAVNETREALTVHNGIEMNGTVLNGTFLNGIKLNGIKLNGIKLNGVNLSGTDLVGTAEDTGLTVRGAALAGADMVGVLGDSSQTTVRVMDVSTTDVPGMTTYTILQDGVNICANGAKAILTPGRWDYLTGDFIDDPDHFTVACRGVGIAKCAEWGYNDYGKWTETQSGQSHDVSLMHFHQSCVRMVRADYCGDGHSHTVNGTVIDVWDAPGIQTETVGSGLPFEAEWTPSGAKCVKHTRWTTAMYGSPESYIKTHCPSVWAGSDAPAANAQCGSSSSTFFTQNGFYADPETRPFLREASDQH